jgi:hypothetical protein
MMEATGAIVAAATSEWRALWTVGPPATRKKDAVVRRVAAANAKDTKPM